MARITLFFEGEEKELAFDKEEITIGRGDDCDITIKSSSVSRIHAIIKNGEIEDQDSRNGTFVNGEKITRHELSDNDKISIGDAELVFSNVLSDRSVSIIDEKTSLLLQTILESVGTTTLDDFLEIALKNVIKITGGDRGVVILKTNGEYEMQLALDKQGNKLDKMEGFSQSIQKKVLEGGEPVFATNTGQQIATESVLKFELRTVMCTPIKLGLNVLGAIYVDSHSVTNPFSRKDLLLLEAVTNHLAVAIENVKANQKREDDAKALSKENEILRNLLSNDLAIVGDSKEIKATFEIIKKVAPTSATILIEGESGTGKEKIARLVHRLSDRTTNPFVVIECASIPETLLESELFGYERGAFTGAVGQKQGRLEAANGGTLFLDEISELPISLQAKFLRAIQELEIVRLGGSKPVKIDVRIVAATNRVLEDMVKDGKFRQDLYFRLNVVKIKLPPLRERGQDITLLAEHFLKESNKLYNRNVRGISREAVDTLLKYTWPGNVRELKHKIEQSVLLSESDYLTVQDLNLNSQSIVGSFEDAKDRFEKQYLTAALSANGFNISRTAEQIGISRQHLQNLVKKYNIRS